ncbi:MAG: hypothetical protein ACREJ5_02420 [Geminicoccaceae bacterium]
MMHWLITSICLALAVTSAARADDRPMRSISGTLTVAPDLARHVGPDDRLIIKLYRPGGGVELDARYQIVSRFELPLAFQAAPSIDMSGQTKFDAYVIEAFTDKNADVLRVAPGELIARTPEPVPLGTTDLRLELNATRK